MRRSYWRQAGWLVAVSVMVIAPMAWAGEESGIPINERMTTLVLQLAAVICAAKVGGTLTERYLRLPSVLGELTAGIIIGPYALGGWVGLFGVPATGGFPVTPELYGIATLASIILLYLAGLETDLPMLLRYSLSGSLVGIGGVIASFAVGAAIAVVTGLADGFTAPAALFLGAVSTATSVGITVRILSERGKLDSPEGVTILTGAVVDDVLGIVVLAVVVGIARLSESGGAMDWGKVTWVAVKALGFWVICTALGLLLAKRIGRFLECFRSRDVMATVSLGMALLLAGLSEKAGLAMIIGAYIMGISLSTVDSASELRRRLEPVYHTLVSVFFCVLGMMVDLPAMKSILVPGLIFAVAAMAAKVIGCSVPAYATGFNLLGATRVGVGMLPRGEVTMIIAGLGLSMGFVSADIFGVAVITTLVCTVVAPIIMIRLFDDRSGLKKSAAARQAAVGERQPMELTLPNKEIAEFLLSRVIEMFENEECYVHQLTPGLPIFQIRKDDISITIKREDAKVTMYCSGFDREFGRLVLLEALAGLVKVFEGLQELGSGTGFRAQLMQCS